MVKRRRTRVFLFGALALLAALLPLGLAGSAQTTGESSLVYLTLGTTDQVTWTSETQTINTRNNCSVLPFGGSDLLDITPSGGDLGFVKDGFGVKSRGDGTGEPCGRVEASDGEELSVSLGSDLGAYLMTAIDVDLELKFNAEVAVTLKLDGTPVFTPYTAEDPFTGTGGSDDGPDSGDGDNFRLFVRPTDEGNPILFDEVVFTPSEGAISLEGGADGTDPADASLDGSKNASQFEVVQAFDGEITCNDSEEIADEAVPGVLGTVTMFAMQFDPEGPDGFDWYINDCLLKPFNESVSDETISFVPKLEGTTGRYTIQITVEGQTVITDDSGQITSLTMVYDPEGNPNPSDPLQPCEGQPIVVNSSENTEYEEFWTADSVELLPGDERACYYNVSVMPTEANVGTEIWDIYFEDDPSFGFK